MIATGGPQSPTLAALGQELEDARQRAHRLVEPPDPDRWERRPEPTAWSAGECLEHLNTTSREYLPRIRAALEPWAAVPRQGGRHYRCDPLGWFLAWVMEPPVRFPTRTTAPFEPVATTPQQEVLAAFDALQQQLQECLVEADGLPLGRIWIRSPFVPALRYNLCSCLRILAAHQRRHLAQAERAAAAATA